MSLQLPEDKPTQVSSKSKKLENMFEGASIAFSKVFKYSIYFLSGCYAVLFLVRMIHFIIPEYWAWLNDDQIQGINNFLFSGISGALIGNYIKGIIAQDKPIRE